MEPYFTRTYKLVLDDRTYKTDGHDALALDIKFDIRYALGSSARFGTVSILGLSYKSIQPYLELSALDRAKAENEMLKVKLDVGYEQTGMVNIFDGHAWFASIDKPPEMWLHLRVSECLPVGGPMKQCNFPYNEEMYEVGTIATEVLGKFGVTFEDLTEEKLGSSKKVSQFYSGLSPLTTIITKLNALADWKIVCRGTKAEAYDANPKKMRPVVETVDSETGLLNVSGITNTNATVTTFLRADMDPGMFRLQLNSDLNRQANGLYRVCERQFVGHYNGNEWYSKFYCTGRIN